MAKNYVQPQINAKSYTCPHCNTLTQVTIKTWHFEEDVSQSNFGMTIHSKITIHRCQCSGRKIIWIDGCYVLYPDIVAEEANVDMPIPVKQLFDEAAMIYNKSPRAACALLRLAIDRLCNESGEKDRDINKNIGELVKKGLPQTVQQALDVVRVVGNKAVHPGQIAFDVDNRETAIKLMHLLNIITERMVTEPKEINALFQNLPESAKDSIEKRDK